MQESHIFWKSLEDKSATKDDIFKFFSSRNYSAVCDVPCLIYWRDIVRAHPHAKIILTVRDPSLWFKSINKALIPISTQIMRLEVFVIFRFSLIFHCSGGPGCWSWFVMFFTESVIKLIRYEFFSSNFNSKNFNRNQQQHSKK